MNKRVDAILFLLISCLSVAGIYMMASAGADETSVPDKTSTTKEYRSIIEQAVRFEKKRDKRDSEAYIQLLDSQLDVSSQESRLWYNHFWSSQDFQYAFYDINHDGSEELLIGDSKEVNAIYSLKAGKPNLQLIGSFDTVGGQRSSLEILQDGTIIQSDWSDYSSDIHATAYRFDHQQVRAKKDTWFTFKSGKTATYLLKESSPHLDLSKLKWYSFSEDSNKTTSDSGN